MSITVRVIWWLLIICLATIIDLIFLRVWRGYLKIKKLHIEKKGEVNRCSLLKEAIMEEFTGLSLKKYWYQPKKKSLLRKRLISILEILLIGFWAIFVGREYLNLDPQVVPTGREFLSAIQTHHMWTRFQDCGWCFLWNGNVRGGYPMFADVHGSMLHPIVILTTLIWGVINGSKIALVISFWCAGIAQWWLAREMRLSWIPRLWSAGIAVVGGHIVGRMELGAFGVVLSTAMCSLVFGGILSVSRDGGKRATVTLSLLLASALISGQGYIQVGLVGILPAMVFLILDNKRKIRPIWKNFVIAVLLACLLAAAFIVPFLHFSPNFTKSTDPEFKSAQPLSYMPLNLVIDDWNFYHSEILGKFPYPHLYTLFIGWVPVILAIIGLCRANKDEKNCFLFFSTVIVFEFLIGSSVLLQWIAKFYPGIAGVRHPPQITGLAIPMILVLSACGLEYLINLPWPNLHLESSEAPNKLRWTFSLRWLLLFPLFFSLKEGYQFSVMWVNTIRLDNGLFELSDYLDSPSLQWVNTPFGEHQYIEYAVRKDLKLSPGIKTWKWKGRDDPIPVLEANRAGPPSEDYVQLAEVDGVPIYQNINKHYAAVIEGDNIDPCTATGSGGYITVVCNPTTPGTLVVQENTWTGWKAWLDGKRIPLLGEQWLTVDAPTGMHTYHFRYLPWDVPLGLILSLIGVIVSIYMWFYNPNRKISTDSQIE